jgi:hypothetical protein
VDRHGGVKGFLDSAGPSSPKIRPLARMGPAKQARA